MNIVPRIDNLCKKFVLSDVPFAENVIERNESLAVKMGDKIVVYVNNKKDFTSDDIKKIKSIKNICGDYQSLIKLGIAANKIELGELMYTNKSYSDNSAIVCNNIKDISDASNICKEAGIADNEDVNILFDDCKNKKTLIALFRLNGQPCGTARANFVNNKVIIGGVATAQKYRGKGFGKIALEKVLHEEAGEVYLFVCNPIAKNMYEKMGFITICTWGRVVGN